MRDKIKNIKEMFKDPKKKAYAFFGFYFVFFIFVFIFMRTLHSTGSKYNSKDYELGNSFSYHYENIKNNNYNYIYSIKLDDKVYEYKGKRYNSSELFNYNDKEYYRYNDNYFINNDIWIKSDNPYKFYEFLDIDNILVILNSSYYESKTVYEDGKINYNLFVSSNTINKLINNIDSDYEEEPNRIVLSVDQNKYISDVSFVLDSYCSLSKLCDKTLRISLSYSDFGSVEEIKNPISE